MAVTLGGDHSIGLGTLAGSFQHNPDTVVLWVINNKCSFAFVFHLPGVPSLMFPLRLTRTRTSTLPRRRPAGTCTACRSAWTLQLILNILEYLLISFKTTSSTAGQLEPCWWSWISYNVILSRLMTWNGTVFQELATFRTTSSTAGQLEQCSWDHLWHGMICC